MVWFAFVLWRPSIEWPYEKYPWSSWTLIIVLLSYGSIVSTEMTLKWYHSKSFCSQPDSTKDSWATQLLAFCCSSLIQLYGNGWKIHLVQEFGCYNVLIQHLFWITFIWNSQISVKLHKYDREAFALPFKLQGNSQIPFSLLRVWTHQVLHVDNAKCKKWELLFCQPNVDPDKSHILKNST